MALALLALAAVGTVALGAVTVLGYRLALDPSLIRFHFMAALVATTILVMAHSFIMFFLIATGVELKEIERSLGGGDSLRRRIVAMKQQAFPVMTMALLLVMANFILGGAAHTRAIPYFVHGLMGVATFMVCTVALYREYRVLGDNNRLIAEVAERRRRLEGSGSHLPR